MQPFPPYRILSTSAEFCLSSAQDPADCESVQFISGIEVELTRAERSAGRGGERRPVDGGPGGEGLRDTSSADEGSHGRSGNLLLTYGVNDCEAKLARMPLDDVMRMLRPLKGESAACVPLERAA